MPVKRIAILASGRGSNFQAVIDAIARGEIPATCCGLITDNPDAYAIERAKKEAYPSLSWTTGHIRQKRRMNRLYTGR